MENFLSFYSAVSAKIFGVWLAVWLIRRRGEIDYPLDGPARALRWIMVGIGFLIGYLPGSNLEYVRLGGFSVGMGFLCWPNLAYHLRNLFGTVEKPPSTDEPNITRL